MQIPDLPPSVVSSQPSAEAAQRVRPQRVRLAEVPETSGAEALTRSGPPESPRADAMGGSRDRAEISPLSQSLLARPDRSARVEALTQAYERGSYQLAAETLARAMVEHYLEGPRSDGEPRKPSPE